MKFALVLMAMTFSLIGQADTLREERIRKEMVDRVDAIRTLIDGTREDLKQENAIEACKKINELFKSYPDHLKAVGTHLDLFRSKTIKAKDDSLSHLIYFHRTSNICSRGTDSEYIDPKLVSKELKKIDKDLRRQRRLIKRTDTDNENSFYYEYQF